MPETLLLDLKKISFPSDARPHTPEKLEMLAQDMKQQGQLQEIIVTPAKGGYEVVAGVGRTLAARKLGWTKIRAMVREGLSPFDKARITFAENENREDADPFYQAMQMRKMLSAKKFTQQALAAELGISDSLVSAYVAIDELKPKVKEISKRLELGQLIQIARLKHVDLQIRVAQKCHKNDLSVRQLKGLVDRSLRNKKAPAKPQLNSSYDPLGQFWKEIAEKSGLPKGLWSTSFNGDNVWRLTIVLPDVGEFKNDMARILRALGNATSDTHEEKVRVVAQQEKALKAAPKTDAEFAQAEQDFEKIRLPKNAIERAVLEAQTMYGPGMVYTWIYGPDSFYTRQYLGKSWEDIGVTDPIKEVRKMVAQLKQLKAAKL